MSDSGYWERIGREYDISILDVASFNSHRKYVGHRPREVCDACPQPITGKIVRYWEDQGVKPRKVWRMGVYN